MEVPAAALVEEALVDGLKDCRHREVEMYSVPPVPLDGSYRPLRRWRCAICKRPVTEQFAGKIIRKAARKAREVTR